jgi:arsenate reductase-like glutaredoxin family protein
MSEEPTKEELQEKIEKMEKRYDEIIEKMQERYSQRSLQIF